MLFKMTEIKYQPNPVLERALDVLFILHADHEQNCSTHAMRGISGSHVDPYRRSRVRLPRSTGRCTAARTRQSCACCRNRINPERPDFIKRKGGTADGLWPPRLQVLRPAREDHQANRRSRFTVTGKNPLLEIALELERIARATDDSVSRRLYPNVDFYSGLIYQAMGFPVDMFPVLFAIPRTAGWIAQWEEMLLDPEQKIARREQIYTGNGPRTYVPRDKQESSHSAFSNQHSAVSESLPP